MENCCGLPLAGAVTGGGASGAGGGTAFRGGLRERAALLPPGGGGGGPEDEEDAVMETSGSGGLRLRASASCALEMASFSVNMPISTPVCFAASIS